MCSDSPSLVGLDVPRPGSFLVGAFPTDSNRD